MNGKEAIAIVATLRGAIVPTLQRGNSSSNAPALRDAERHWRHSHAEAWER
jgi:hypothetical protein